MLWNKSEDYEILCSRKTTGGSNQSAEISGSVSLANSFGVTAISVILALTLTAVTELVKFLFTL